MGDEQVGGSGEELKIGHVGHNNWAGIAHKNSAGSGGYALIQRSDGMTLLNSASGQDLRFRINNSDKMTVKSNGNVGIGTNNPSEKFSVNGGEVGFINGGLMTGCNNETTHCFSIMNHELDRWSGYDTTENDRST